MLYTVTYGSNPYDIGLGQHGSQTQKPLKIAVKQHLAAKFSSPAARFEGLRLGDCARQPQIGYPGRHHHPRQPGSGSRRPGVHAKPAARAGTGLTVATSSRP